MKTRKKIFPNWITKNIQYGRENENVSSIVVGAVALYIVGVIGLFVSKPFGGENLWMESCVAICVLALIIAIGFIFIARVALLEKERIKAVKAYKKAGKKEQEAKSSEERTKAMEDKSYWEGRLNSLFVRLEDVA
jgi:uncharacterized protein YacL|nr:hypothetical protein [bacterium]